MSVYHREQAAHLRASMESIFSQTVPTDDFVLICDGPLTDALDGVIADAVRAHPDVLRVVRLEHNCGLSGALNHGLPLCRNELVARMDSDDVALPGRCALQLAAFANDPALSIVGGAIDEFEQTPENVVSHKSMPPSHDEILHYARYRNPFNHPTVMYRRSVILSLGGYPEHNLHEDYALWANLLLSGAKACNLPETLLCMRVDGGLYRRRGGIAYLRQAIRLRWGFYRRGLYTLGSFLYVSAGLTFVCLIPTSLRKSTYRKVLR